MKEQKRKVEREEEIRKHMVVVNEQKIILFSSKFSLQMCTQQSNFIVWHFNHDCVNMNGLELYEKSICRSAKTQHDNLTVSNFPENLTIWQYCRSKRRSIDS